MPSGPRPYEPQRALGKAVRVLRERANLSQGALAERAGISASWLSRIESGDYDPSWGNLRRVTSGLDVSMAKLSEVAEELDQEEGRSNGYFASHCISGAGEGANVA